MPLNAAKLTRDVTMEQTPIQYHLSGMILYYGTCYLFHSYTGKHYVAMCLYEYEGRFYWMECNDTKFRHFEDNASMIDHCVQAAYQPILLFYRKDDVDSNVGTNAFPQSVAPRSSVFPDSISSQVPAPYSAIPPQAQTQGAVPYPVGPTQAPTPVPAQAQVPAPVQGGYPNPLPVAPTTIPSGYPEPLPVAPTQAAGYVEPLPIPSSQGISMNIYGDQAQEVARESAHTKPVNTSSLVDPYPEPVPSYPPHMPPNPQYPSETVPSYPPAPIGRYSPANPAYTGAVQQNLTPPAQPQPYPS